VEKEGSTETCDLIFVGFPGPTDDSLSRLYSKEFYLMLRNILAKDGMAVIQSGGYLTTGQKNHHRYFRSCWIKNPGFLSA